MPLYEYRCESCGAAEEKLEPLSAPERHGCPQCGTDGGMARQLSRVAFSFSGGGWYAQGYGEGKGGKGEAKPEAAEAKTEAATKTEAKPAAGCGGGCACHPA